jgi:hypothetical protein
MKVSPDGGSGDPGLRALREEEFLDDMLEDLNETTEKFS